LEISRSEERSEKTSQVKEGKIGRLRHQAAGTKRLEATKTDETLTRETFEKRKSDDPKT